MRHLVKFHELYQKHEETPGHDKRTSLKCFLFSSVIFSCFELLFQLFLLSANKIGREVAFRIEKKYFYQYVPRLKILY